MFSPNKFKGEHRPSLSAEEALDVVMGEQVSEMMQRLVSEGEGASDTMLKVQDSGFERQEKAREQLLRDIKWAEKALSELEVDTYFIDAAELLIKAKKAAGQSVEDLVKDIGVRFKQNRYLFEKWSDVFGGDPEIVFPILASTYNNIRSFDDTKIAVVAQMVRVDKDAAARYVQAITSPLFVEKGPLVIGNILGPMYRDGQYDTTELLKVLDNELRIAEETKDNERKVSALRAKAMFLACVREFDAAQDVLPQLKAELQKSSPRVAELGIGGVKAWIGREMMLQSIASSDDDLALKAAGHLNEASTTLAHGGIPELEALNYLVQGQVLMGEFDQAASFTDKGNKVRQATLQKYSLAPKFKPYMVAAEMLLDRGQFERIKDIGLDALGRSDTANFNMAFNMLLSRNQYDFAQQLVDAYGTGAHATVLNDKKLRSGKDASYIQPAEITTKDAQIAGINKMSAAAQGVLLARLTDQDVDRAASAYYGASSLVQSDMVKSKAEVKVLVCKGEDAQARRIIEKDSQNGEQEAYIETKLLISLYKAGLRPQL